MGVQNFWPLYSLESSTFNFQLVYPQGFHQAKQRSEILPKGVCRKNMGDPDPASSQLLKTPKSPVFSFFFSRMMNTLVSLLFAF